MAEQADNNDNQLAKSKFFAFALEIERHREKLGIHGADSQALEQRFRAFLERGDKEA